MKRTKEKLLVFAVGGALYCLLEMLWRGFTHPSMAFAGGVCLCMIHAMRRACKKVSIWIKCLMGSAIITSVELVTGVIVNLKLNLNVWDYSRAPLNFLGQICIPFCIVWYILTLPALGLARFIDCRLLKHK